MEVKRVRVSVACDACKKRRGKCAGTAPCDYCVEHNIPCRFSTKSKKRGPASKHPKPDNATAVRTNPIVHPRYQDFQCIFNNYPANPTQSHTITMDPLGSPFTYDTSAPLLFLSLIIYPVWGGVPPRVEGIFIAMFILCLTCIDIEEYLANFSYLPPFNNNVILTPTTLHHQMVRFAVLAHMAKTMGDHDRCVEFFGAARQISGQIFDEPTYDSAMAYVLLTCISMMSSDKRAAHYAHLSWSHAKDLLTATKEWRAIQLLHQSYVLVLALDESLSPAQKLSILSNYITNIKKTNLSGCLVGGAALFLCLDARKVRQQGFLAALGEISYSTEARERHFQDIERTELLLNANLVNSPSHKWGLLVLVKMYRTLGELWSGNYSRAAVSAQEMIEASQRPELVDMMTNPTVITAIMPNLVSFGTLHDVMKELLKYFTTQPGEEGNGPTLVISPNIAQLAHNVNSPSSNSSSSVNHIENLINASRAETFSLGGDPSAFSHNHNSNNNNTNNENNNNNTLPPPNFPQLNLPNPNSRKSTGLFSSIINNSSPLSTIDSFSLGSFHNMHAPHLPNPLPSPMHSPHHNSLPFPSSSRSALSPRDRDPIRSTRPPSPPGFRYPLWPQ